MVSSIVLDAIAAACGVLGRQGGSTLWEARGDRHGERRDERFEPSPELAALLRGDAAVVAVDPEGGIRIDPAWPAGEAAVVSGSFNPLHAGHLGLAAAAERHLGRRVSFELSIANAEKPTLEPLELHRRAAQFPGRAPLVLTRDALFVEKARRFQGCVFVVGADTAARVLDARFYGGTTERDHALQALRAAGGRFLVAGRQSGERFLTIDDLALPAAGEGLFEALPAEAFRSDLSSSAIRDSWRERV